MLGRDKCHRACPSRPCCPVQLVLGSNQRLLKQIPGPMRMRSLWVDRARVATLRTVAMGAACSAAETA